MRPELTILEQIDLYLSGDLSQADKALFESKLSNDPNLQHAFNQQQELIKAVKRKALRAQINAAAAAGGGFSGGLSNMWIGLGSVLGIGLIIGSIFYFNSADEKTVSTENERVEKDAEMVATNLIETDLELSENNLILEEPETIFSSNHNYNEDEEEKVKLLQNDYMKIGDDLSIEKKGNSGGVLREVQNKPKVVEVQETEIPEAVDRTSRATYPGGNYAMDKFIDKNLHYPRSAKNKGIEGVVRCDFLVTPDGLITEIDAKCTKMSEGDGPAFNDVKMLLNIRIMNAFINNATHILRTMPNWEPATNSQGNPILSPQRMYFNYDLKQGCLVYQLDEHNSFSNENENELEIIKEFEK